MTRYDDLPTPNIQCARCHGSLSSHHANESGRLVHAGRKCSLSADDVREQVYAWADYALLRGDQARERNYRERTGWRGTPERGELNSTNCVITDLSPGEFNQALLAGRIAGVTVHRPEAN